MSQDSTTKLPPGLTVVVGPARSGKTELLLRHYRPALRPPRVGKALWIGPTARSAAQTRGRLLEPELPACLDPGVMTFERFAGLILRAADEPIRPIDSVQKRLLLERLAVDALAAGELEYFAPIAETAGFVELLAQYVSELKRLEIWPDQYALVGGLRPNPKDRDLALLYGRYQEWLNRGRLYDAEGGFWWARTLLRDLEASDSTRRYQLIVADGFADFTYTQHEILDLLVARSERVLVSLPLESGRQRRDLFRKSRQTLDQFRERHSRLNLIELPAADAGGSGLTRLERRLFSTPRVLPSASAEPITERRKQAAPIQIMAATSTQKEMEWIARSIKQLLWHGDPALPKTPVRPGDIVVAIRGLGELGTLVAETFQEYGLPFAIETSPSLDRVPAIAAMLNWVRLELEDWPHEQLLAAISNGYFRPTWKEWRQGDAALDIDWIVRDLQIPSGRDRLRERLADYAQAADASAPMTPGTSELVPDVAATAMHRHQLERRRHAAGALPTIDRLIKALASIPKSGSGRAWAQALQGLAAELDVDQVLAEDSRDRQAWGRLLAALVAEEDLSLALGQVPRQLDRRQFLRLAHDLCRWEKLAGGGSEEGRIRILTAESVRGLSVPYLFLGGLSESSFPQHREPTWHRRREIDQLRAAGLRFEPPMDRAEDEMLLFYEVLTRATRRVYLSYPALDSAAAPLLPSPYLVEVERACEPQDIASWEQPLSQAAVLHEAPLSPREFRLQALASAVEGLPDRLAALLGTGEAWSKNVLAGCATGIARSDRERFGPFEGLVTGGAALESLTGRFGPDRCWNTSDLERYAYCPFQFFLRQVLSIEPLADLRLEIDYLQRGRLLHDAMAAVYRRLGTVDADPALEDPELFRRQFEQAVDELLATADDAGPLAAAWGAIDRRVVVRWCENYLRQVVEYASNGSRTSKLPRPKFFEVSFGMPSEAETPPSVAQPLELSDGHERIFMRGRIDRIDVGSRAGKTVVSVVDYKGSSGKKLQGVGELDRTALQADVYAIAAAELILADRQAIPVASGYWYLRRQGYVPAFQVDPADEPDFYDARRKELVRTVLELARGPRRGEFPVHCADDECTGRCDFRTVCRVNQIRNLEKTWQPSEPGER